MPRKRRLESPTGVYHWIVRGMNRRNIFHSKEDFEAFKALLLEYKSIFEIEIFHYCLMTNHAHLLLRCPTLESLAKFSHYIQRRYAYYYCKTHKLSGSVFRKGYKSICVDKDTYLLECGRYIERNPIKAGLSKTVEGYTYTSFPFYSKGQQDNLLTPSPAFLGLSNNAAERRAIYTRYVTEHRIYEEMSFKS
jgi:putative transposase